MKFSKEFLLGAATSAHQTEGNNIYSDAWAQEQMRSGGYREPSGRACDAYNRCREDIAMLAAAGLNAYRFTVEWARVEPEEGKFDSGAIEHYRDVLLTCREFGVEPIVTLHHFSSPKWLISSGGLGVRENNRIFRAILQIRDAGTRIFNRLCLHDKRGKYGTANRLAYRTVAPSIRFASRHKRKKFRQCGKRKHTSIRHALSANLFVSAHGARRRYHRSSAYGGEKRDKSDMSRYKGGHYVFASRYAV